MCFVLSYTVADALSEVFDTEWTWAPDWVPRVIRILQYSSLQSSQHARQADINIRRYVPDCCNRHTYLVAVNDEPTRPPQSASDEFAPNFTAPNRAPALLTAMLDMYLRHQANKFRGRVGSNNVKTSACRGKISTQEESMTLGNETPKLAGVISLDTMTEFAPPRTKPHEHGSDNTTAEGAQVLDCDCGVGVPDPLWAPHRFERRKIGYVSNLVVRPDYRRQGVGRALLQDAERCAKEWGCRSLGLHCEMGNKGMTPSPPFRHRCFPKSGGNLKKLTKTLRHS
eukprot:1181754-Prorocentrum_minimum.AAC.4